jgi:hypothetical protein
MKQITRKQKEVAVQVNVEKSKFIYRLAFIYCVSLRL